MSGQSKLCIKCDIEKDTSEFNKDKNTGDGFSTYCRDCRSNLRKACNFSRKIEGNKQCSLCGIVKDVSLFHKDKCSTDGLNCTCIACKKINYQKKEPTLDEHCRKMFNDLKHNAIKRSIEVKINLINIKDLYNEQNCKCKFTGKQLTHDGYPDEKRETHIRNKWNISVDRINSTKKSYEIDNIQIVGAIVNRIKMNLNDKYFINLCKKMIKVKITNLMLKGFNINEDIICLNKIDYNNTINFEEIDNYQCKEIKKNSASTFDGYMNKMYCMMRCNNQRRNKDLEFDITMNDIKELYKKQKGLCRFTEEKLTYLSYQTNDKSNLNEYNLSVDRIDSSKGYTKDNIQLVGALINRMKGDLSDDEFLEIAAMVAEYRKDG